MSLRITEHCKRQGITLQELAERIGIARSTLANTLSKGNPTIETLGKIARALEVPISELLDDGNSGDGDISIKCPKCGNSINLKIE